jgi:hypothetical protein
MNRKKPARLELRERGDGRQPMWVIVDSNKKRFSTGCTVDDLEGAKRALADYLLQHTSPAKNDDPAGARLGHVLAYYLRVHGPEVEDEAGIRQRCKHLGPFWAELTLLDVTGARCREYIEARTATKYRGRNIRPVTASKELTTLQTAINFWAREKGLPLVPRVTKKEAARAGSGAA